MTNPSMTVIINSRYADVAELADAPDLGSGAKRRMSSSLFVRTRKGQIPDGICLFQLNPTDGINPPAVGEITL